MGVGFAGVLAVSKQAKNYDNQIICQKIMLLFVSTNLQVTLKIIVSTAKCISKIKSQ